MNFDPLGYNKLKVTALPIPGMFEVDLVIHGDKRGWFKENYQATKMEALGLPHFIPVQNNFSYNSERGVTRGLHAEPWEKFISLANGRAFCAWTDLRKGLTFGMAFTLELDPGKAIFVPRGVANGYQTLEENVTYTYLVNAHWTPDVKYTAVNLYDPVLAIAWPIAKEQAIISDKDLSNPALADIHPQEF